jgi:class 3 adenylate cyclase
MLSDEQILPFVTRFLNRIAGLMREAAMPLAVNTWGDGFFATFRGVGEAGRFALKLAEVVETTDWKSDGLPAEFNIRMALHAGPVFAIRDPVTDRPGYWGGHVSRAARIEPITPPGQVYASQAFAALARDEGECGFACHYVGRTPLAKDYGTFPTYHVVVSR